MKILIAGLAKTGTTGLLYLVANSFGAKPRILFEPKVCPADLGPPEGNVVAKILIGPKLDAASFAHFDRKITIVRDPRDRVVSALLYSQFHGNYLADGERVRIVRECLERKEADPSSLSIREILELVGKVTGKPDALGYHRRTVADALEWLRKYVATIPDGLFYKYEDFVSGRYAVLEKHLGMPITGAAEVPDRLRRVSRTQAYGDWRNWFTPQDVEDYKPLFAQWLDKHGYDPDDWTLNASPVIEREHCSGYFLKLVEERRGGSRCRAKIMRAEPDVVLGWAIGDDPHRPARVMLVVNGNEVAQAVANRPRPALQKEGVHPTGKCGFVFRFEPGKLLRVGDEVTVRPVGADFAFEHAPRAVRQAAASVG